MITRRSVLNIISGLFVGAAPISKLLACSGAGEYTYTLISTPSKNLENFLSGNINKYLNHYYGSKWDWSNDIEFTLDSRSTIKNPKQIYIADNWSTVPVIIDARTDYLKDNEYCSNITLIYNNTNDTNDKFHSEITLFKPVSYKILSYNHSKEVLPYLHTRIKMSSHSAEIYAVFTVRNLITNNIDRIDVTQVPLTVYLHSCNHIEFKYVVPNNAFEYDSVKRHATSQLSRYAL